MIEPQLLGALQPEHRMGRRQDQAAAGEVRPHQLAEPFLGRGVERAGRLVEQPDRALDSEQARDREPAALPGGKIGGGQVGERVEPDRSQRLGDVGGACAEESPTRIASFRRPKARASGRPGGRDNGPARRRSVPGRRRPRRCRPWAMRTSPTTMRSSDDFPAPLRPLMVKASPEATEKLDAGENVAAAALAGQIRGGKPHR